MRFSEILRLVLINLFQNKFKVILTSIGIVVGAATIVMVIAIGRGGQMDVADQFKNINAGAIDISYTRAFGGPGGGRGGSSSNFPSPGGNFLPASTNASTSSQSAVTTLENPQGSSATASVQALSAQANGNFPAPGGDAGGFTPPEGMQPPPGLEGGGGGFAQFFAQSGGSNADSRVNFERITLSETDVEDFEVFVPGISAVTISYSTRSNVNGGDLESETAYTIAGVMPDYAELSNLSLAAGDFITEDNEAQADKVCVLGAALATEIFGSVNEAYDSILYIDNRPYVVNGILNEMGSLSSGISADEAIFIPYATGIKYITGQDVSATITVIAQNVDNVPMIIEDMTTVLAESYPNATFTIEDAGTKMEAANASNRTLTMLLFAMAAIVFIVGGIGIMNVLFVSIKERTKEIGILKSIGCRKRDILLEFLLEASFISIVGGLLGAGVSVLVTPIVQLLSVRVEHSLTGFVLAIVFAILTGTAFGFYPALKASKLIPVQALNSL